MSVQWGVGSCVLSALLIAACGGDSTTGSSYDSDDVAERLPEVVAARCDCAPSPAERETCRADVDSSFMSTGNCHRQVLASSDGQVLLDCLGRTVEDGEHCMAAAACDTELVEACQQEFWDGLDACHLASAAASERLRECDLPL